MQKKKKQCPEGKRRNEKGRCVNNCSIDKEVINDKCLKKCAPNKIRNDTTKRCIKDKSLLLPKEPKQKKQKAPKISKQPINENINFIEYLKNEYKNKNSFSSAKRKFLMDSIAVLPDKYIKEIMS